jgi:hemerythrin-like domain-containing protein
MKNESVTLQELRSSLDQDTQKKTKFVTLLEKHHDYLEDCISVLTDRDAAADEKRVNLSCFLHILNMHAKAEEETLYQSLVESDEKEARLEGVAGQDEHDIAYQLAGELKSMDFDYEWTEEVDAKAKVLANLVLSHLKEEEGVMFPTARKNIDGEELQELGAEYIDKCKSYLDAEIKISGVKPFIDDAMVASF